MPMCVLPFCEINHALEVNNDSWFITDGPSITFFQIGDALIIPIVRNSDELLNTIAALARFVLACPPFDEAKENATERGIQIPRAEVRFEARPRRVDLPGLRQKPRRCGNHVGNAPERRGRDYQRCA